VDEILYRHSPLELERVPYLRDFIPLTVGVGLILLEAARRIYLMSGIGTVAFRTHFAEVAGGTEAALRRKAVVVIAQGKGSRVRRHPHFARPSEGAEGIVGSRLDVARHTGFRVGDIKRNGRWYVSRSL
jgi:hypothetical protein